MAGLKVVNLPTEHLSGQKHLPPDDNNSFLSDGNVSDEDLYTFPAMTGASVFGVGCRSAGLQGQQRHAVYSSIGRERWDDGGQRDGLPTLAKRLRGLPGRL